MIRVTPFGDRALVVRFDQEPSDELSRYLAVFAQAAAKIEGVVDAAPGYRTILIEADASAHRRLTSALLSLDVDAGTRTNLLHHVQVRYDGEDIDWVCKHKGKTREELVRLHSEPTYTVRLIGSPGFIYLSSIDPNLATPRRHEPRPTVPEGAVGIAGMQTGIYGRPRPGGWRLIATAMHVPVMKPGDEVKFLP